MRTLSLSCSLLLLASCSRTVDPTREGTASASTVLSTTAPPPDPLLPGATCRFPARLDHDVVISAGCVADVRRSTFVEAGHVLTIEPGATLRFAKGTFLEVGHRGSRIVAKGTKERPILLTSAAATKRPGDWVGLAFGDAIGAEGSVLEHVTIEYAGAAEHGGRGAITVFAPVPAGRIALRDDVLTRNAQRAIDDPHLDSAFAAFEGNVVSGNAHGLRVAAQTLASLGDRNTLDDDVEIVGGVVERGGRFPATRAPILVSAPISVNGSSGETSTLVVADGATLAFAPKTWLEIGTHGPAALFAEHVTLTSSAAAPAAGDWVGVIFGEDVKRSRMSASTIEYAGAEEHGGDGAITFVGKRTWLGLDVSLYSLTFRDVRQSNVSANGEGCDKALDPRNGFSWDYRADFCH